MIKLCYKEYEWKASMGACKLFAEKTGMDLKRVFCDYIEACINMPDSFGPLDKMQAYSKLHERRIASIALHCIIKAADDSVSLDEIDDATFRVDWILSDRPDDLSEPWPFVMLNAALEINAYMNDNIPKKKEADT
jgi:hypothetical protein